MRRLVIGALAAMAAVTGCKSGSSTAIDVTVVSDASLALETVGLTASATGKSNFVRDFPMKSPLVVTIAPTGLANGATVTIEARGERGGATVIIARRSVSIHEGGRAAVMLELRQDCEGVLTCAPTETCEHQLCVPIPPPTDGVDGGVDVANGGRSGGGGAPGQGGNAGRAGLGGESGKGGDTGASGAGGGAGTGGGAGGASAGGASGSGASGGGAATGGTMGTGGAGGGTSTGGAGGGVGCGSTQHLCTDACVDNASISHCGTSCTACQPPAGGTATCNGTTCDFTCTGTVKRCPGGTSCIPSTGCCSNSDCPAMAGGQTGSCDSGTHSCSYGCPSNTTSCTAGGTTTCIPSGGCCVDADCAGDCRVCNTTSHTCGPAANRADPNGRCAGTCDASGVCKSARGQTCTTTPGGCVTGTVCSNGACCTQSCGTDATCAGSCAGRSDGVCQFPTVRCGSATCSSTRFVDRGTCGAGTCTAPAATDCSNHLICAANACKTSCASATDCVPAGQYYCQSSACMAKHPAGDLCTADEQCSSNVCGGRCCTTGTTCNCAQPSVANKVVNAGFDSGTTGWVSSPGATTSRDPSDGIACPFSGSLHITGAGQTNPVYQCVPMTPDAVYNFGVRLKVDVDGTDGGCSVALYATADCSGPPQVTGLSGAATSFTTWSVDSGGSFKNGSSSIRARIECYSTTNAAFSVDMVYLSPDPAHF